MPPTQLIVFSLALLMAAVAIAMLRKQARAASCPRHQPLAGRIATVLGWSLLLFAGVVAWTAWLGG